MTVIGNPRVSTDQRDDRRQEFLWLFDAICQLLLLGLILSGSLVVVLATAVWVQAAPKATIALAVDTTLDSNDAAYQACTPAPADCSLRGAITTANNDVGNRYELKLAAATYTLTRGGSGENNNASGDLDILGSLTIQGVGQSDTTIDAGELDRVIHVSSSAQVTLRDLTLTNGKTPDGASSAPGGSGGGIYNSGVLTVTDSTIRHNQTGAGGMGEPGERGGDGGGGGAIYNAGQITLYAATISENQTGAGGGGGVGGICLPPACPIPTPEDGGPGGDGGNGAAIFNASGSTITMTHTTLNNNATGNGGESNEPSSSGPHVLAGDGGLGGGIYNVGAITIANSTLSGNVTGNGGNSEFATDPTAGSGGHGGGLYNSGSLTLANVTVTANCTGTMGMFGLPGAGASEGLGGGLYLAAGTLQYQNTILAGNDSPINASDDCHGAPTSQGYNLVGIATGCPSSGTGDQSTTNALLDVLADNGGTTFSHALLAGSPAIDFGHCTTSLDQRRALRPGTVNPNCDIGAYELQGSATAPVLAIAANGGSFVLSWQPSVGVCGQALHASELPDFVPGSTTLLDPPGVIDAAKSQTSVANSVAAGGAVYFRLQFLGCAGNLDLTSNGVGAVSFGLVPGTP